MRAFLVINMNRLRNHFLASRMSFGLCDKNSPLRMPFTRSAMAIVYAITYDSGFIFEVVAISTQHKEFFMQLSGNTVLITGGSDGIGLALAKRFLTMGNKVIICGRQEEKLEDAQRYHPELITRICNLTQEEERTSLAAWLNEAFPDLNILINNAGIQNRMNILTSEYQWRDLQQEIAVNLEAPLHLSFLLAKRLSQKRNASIINVSSALAFISMAAAPIYCATKAAIHSFSISLRAQLASAGIEVIEIVPPMVQTDLCAPGVHIAGIPVDEFADAVMLGLGEGKKEIGYSYSIPLLSMSREELDKATGQLNAKVPY